MTVEERRDSNARGTDQFPAGLRVLAVDDDSTCLKLLETLLRRCQYHVTTTNQAIVALKLLRENKDKFDLVISDVHMPDMDGFKLLELVGLEMDLPVIMLSGNSDPKVVMQGITHGACDYLLKPVRMEELRNIWQHVIRRKKFDSKDRNGCDQRDDQERNQNAGSEGGHGPALSGTSERNGRLSRKRKDQNVDDDDDEFDENAQENEDSSAQKKQRVVWTVELHRKFVAAVHQLGIDKAMPKRILDLMNDEKLTRENVASHLQKYRLYLKRISTVANQQANMVATLGAKDAHFLSMSGLDGVRNYSTFPGSGQLTTLASFQQGAMLGRLNSASNQLLYGLGSGGMIQLGRTHTNTINPIHDFGKFPQISFSGSGSQQVNLIPGMPISLDSTQLQQQKITTESGNNLRNSPPNSQSTTLCNLTNSFLTPSNNVQIPQLHNQQSDSFGNMSSDGLATISSNIFEGNAGVSSNPIDLSRCNESWATAVPIAGYASNIMPPDVSFGQENFPSTNARDNLSDIVQSSECNTFNAFVGKSLVSPLTNPMIGRDVQCQVDSFHPNTRVIASNENSYGILDIRGPCSSVQRWDSHSDHSFQQSFPCDSLNSNLDVVNSNIEFDSGASAKMMGATGMRSNANASFSLLNPGSQKSICNDQPKDKEEYGRDSTKLQGGFNSISYSAFDELMSVIVKQERDDALMDSDVGCDIFSLETCM